MTHGDGTAPAASGNGGGKVAPPRSRHIVRSLRSRLVTCIVACALSAGCVSGATEREGEESGPTPQAFPAHLCDSRIPTSPLRRIYPKGTAGPVYMSRDDRSTGDIAHFMNTQAETGNSLWQCWIQFLEEDADAAVTHVHLSAIARGNPTSLERLGRVAGYGARSLSLGVVHGVNGPQQSALKFPCQKTGGERVTLLVNVFHRIDRDAADARREQVRRTSAAFVREVARHVVETLHPCKNLPTFPSGDFTSTPFPEATSPQPSGGR